MTPTTICETAATNLSNCLFMAEPAQATRRRKRALAEAVAGVAGSLVSLWAFYPIEVWKTNLQAGSSVTSGKQVSLFRGCFTKSLHTASSSFCYFFLYSWICDNWKRRAPTAKLHPGTRLLLSAVAAMLNTFVTLPLDVISSRNVIQGNKVGVHYTSKMEQVWESSSDEDDRCAEKRESQDPSTKLRIDGRDCTGKREESLMTKDKSLEIADAENEGIAGLWKGLTPALLLCSNPSINYTVFDVAKNQLLCRKSQQTSSLTMPEAFVLGLFSKFVATVATYPLIRAKVILMVTSEKSLLGSLIQSYNKEGVRGLYKGFDWQLLHTVLKSALMMMVREKITVSTHKLIVGG